ncbi:MAG: M16 family metallopeptidase [Planctomycetota bacterium]
MNPTFDNANDFPELASKVRFKTLANGFRVIVVPRGEAPVVSFHTYVDVGSVDERPGITGIAHMFEHMAFKGSRRIGTKNWEQEKRALDQEEIAYLTYREASDRNDISAPELKKNFESTVEHALAFVASEEYSTAIERSGGVGLNASTSTDSTQYYYSLPANKIELWAWLESERFADPVLREFYKERDVVQEERRLRTDSNPLGKMIEEALIAAFENHPYGRPVIGFQKDLEHFSRTEALEFYKQTYGPSKMVIAIVGKVDPEQTYQLVERYFSRIEANTPVPAPPQPGPREPGEKRLEVPLAAQPVYVSLYRRPNVRHEDDPVYQVIADLLGGGDYSRLQKAVVKTGLALACQAAPEFPGGKYTTGFLIFAIPSHDHSVEEIETVIDKELESLAADGPTPSELAGVRERAKSDFLSSIETNSGLAHALATNEAIGGGWRETFKTVTKINSITAERVKAVAAATLTKTNRTVVVIKTNAASKP